MWRSVWAFVLIPAVVAAQSLPSVSEPTSTATPGQVTTVPKAPSYRAYTYYTQIRQGSKEDAAVALSVAPWVISSHSTSAGLMPLKLELQNTEDIQVAGLQYPKSRRQVVQFRSDRIPVSLGWPIRFRISTSRKAAVGPHVLTGKLIFQVVNEAGISEPQTINVEIPITVVPHDAKVQKGPWPYQHMNKAWIPVIAVLCVILLPLLLPMFVICGIGGDIGCG